VESLKEIKPWFIEEPTAPDDILDMLRSERHSSHMGLGLLPEEHAHNRVVFKQMLQVCSHRIFFTIITHSKYLRHKPLMSVKSTLAVLQA